MFTKTILPDISYSLLTIEKQKKIKFENKSDRAKLGKIPTVMSVDKNKTQQLGKKRGAYLKPS